MPVSALPGFADGDVSVQDGSAQRVADALAPPRGARVLDACAAPGGKAAHLLERDPSLQLLALDVEPARLRNVRATLDRLALGATAALRVADAADVGAWWDGRPFDAILLDAPCSATGVVRRQPDILLHRRESDIAELTRLQARLLKALWPTLAPGGVLLYATCSILRDENDRQVAASSRARRTPASRRSTRASAARWPTPLASRVPSACPARTAWTASSTHACASAADDGAPLSSAACPTPRPCTRAPGAIPGCSGSSRCW